MTELLGHCIGVVGMSLDDFCRLRFDEIDEILRSWAAGHRNAMHDGWERMRLHTFLMLSPFCKNLPKPKELLPFPWEEEPEEIEEPEEPMTDDERAAVFEERKRSLGWE